MRLGISALLYNLEDALEICDRIESINHIEIGVDNISQCIDLYRYKDRIEKMNLSIGIHLPMELNTCENIEFIRDKWVEFIYEMKSELSNFDIKYFNLHLGHVMTNRLTKNRNKYLDNSIKFLQKISLYIDENISIENVYTKYGDYSNLGNLVNDFEYIFSKIQNNITFCYDTGHDLINKSDYLEKLQNKISVIHLSDNDGLEDTHIGIGRGVLPKGTIRKVLDLNPEYLVLEIDYKYIEESIKIINLL